MQDSLKNQLSQVLRRSGLSKVSDQLRMYWYKWSLRKVNAQFVLDNPSVVLPDDVIMYETFNLNYRKYFESGREVANLLLELQQPYQHKGPIAILDWGCGPARVVRHMPSCVSSESEVHACDFNAQTIAWCQENIKDVAFFVNQLTPPLPLGDQTMDFVYGISVLTHLSLENHGAWLGDLRRVIKPGGILILTTQGEVFKCKLLPEERDAFEGDKLVVRGGTEEGRRTYSAFHPEAYMKALFKDWIIKRHLKGQMRNGMPQQDFWMVERL